MPPGPPSLPHGQSPRLRRPRLGAAIGLLCLAPLPAFAQEGQAPGVAGAEEPEEIGSQQEGFQAPIGEVPGDGATGEREIDFEADGLEYNSETEVVTASGNVILRSGDQSVRADAVSWNRMSGQIVATGNIRFVDEDGNQLFTGSS
jgi:LPS-assembly protein